jgi:hypothetical protein
MWANMACSFKASTLIVANSITLLTDSIHYSANNVGGSEASPTPSFTMWEPPRPPNTNTSTNGRRVEAMTLHRRVTPLISSNARGVRRVNAAPRSTNHNTAKNDLLKNYKFDIAILANPVSNIQQIL